VTELDLLIRSRRIVTESGWLDGAVGISGERIAALAPASDLPEAKPRWNPQDRRGSLSVREARGEVRRWTKCWTY